MGDGALAKGPQATAPIVDSTGTVVAHPGSKMLHCDSATVAPSGTSQADGR
jgi:hypothetical protein